MCLVATILDNADIESRIQIPQFISSLVTFQVLNSHIRLVVIILTTQILNISITENSIEQCCSRKSKMCSVDSMI